MPRKPTPPPDDPQANVNAELIAEDAKAIDQDRQRLAAIDQRFGDELVYDLHRVMQQARFYLQHSADFMLEAGKCLILLKEHEPHGEFLNALQEIGIAPRTAQRMMQAAAKFTGKRKALVGLGKTKLIELMVEDDEELDALAEGETLAGFSLDEIDRMSTRELRDALRNERHDNGINKDKLNEKNREIDELDKKLRVMGLAPPAWPRIVDETVIQSAAACNQALEACDKLDVLREQILTGDLGDRSDKEMEAAIERMAVEYYDCVIQVWSRVGQMWADCQTVFQYHKQTADERAANVPAEVEETPDGFVTIQ